MYEIGSAPPVAEIRPAAILATLRSTAIPVVVAPPLIRLTRVHRSLGSVGRDAAPGRAAAGARDWIAPRPAAIS